MKRLIKVHSGEIMAGGEETILRSDTNNACMVYVAYDAAHKIGGLAHSMLLSGSLGSKWSSSLLHEANKAIDELIEDMSLLGAKKEDIKINLVSGENIPYKKDDEEYQRNLKSALDIVRTKNIKIEEESVRDIGKSHVALDVETGAISIA